MTLVVVTSAVGRLSFEMNEAGSATVGNLCKISYESIAKPLYQ